MSVLSRFERIVERLIEGSAFRLLGGDLQPVEIAKQLARAMETGREIGPGGQIAPNHYEVTLGPVDYARFADRRASLEAELADYLIRTAAGRGFRLDRRPTVRLGVAETLARHQVEIEGRFVDEVPVEDEILAGGLTARLQIGPRAARSLPEVSLVDPKAARTVPVNRFPFAIGRGRDNDLVIGDKRVSRQHALLKEIDGQICVVDLDSTNGTFVNGQPVRQSVLADTDALSFGGYTTTVRFGNAR